MAVIYLCPADKRLLCSWEGYASDIKQHFEKEHNGLLSHTNSLEIDLNILQENRLLLLEDETYLIQSYIQNDKLFLKLRYLGSSADASKIQYEIVVSVDNILYQYDAGKKFPCVLPKPDEWMINLQQLEELHGKLETLTCSVLLQHKFGCTPSRKASEVSLNIGNIYVEQNAYDETEMQLMEGLLLIDEKIEQLKYNQQLDAAEELIKDDSELKKKENGDIMDRISLLNFEMLEKSTLESNLSCTSCTLNMLPPIYLCLEGHNVCSRCKTVSCKLCNSKITTTRNIDLENISRTHKHFCRYHSDGCNERLMYNEVRAHEARCLFCKYKCTNECHFEGKYLNFLNHLKIVHSSIKIIYTTHFEFPKNTEMYVVNNNIGIFYCYSKQTNDYIRWTAVFCGPKERHFSCDIEFKNSKFKDKIFLKRRENIYEFEKFSLDLKKMKAKDKNAFLTITTYDNW